VKSEDPDIFIEHIYQRKTTGGMSTIIIGELATMAGVGLHFYWGSPYHGGNNVSTRTEGSLYIDVIDAKNKELVGKEGALAP